jgi:hypothetical protein
VLGTVYAMAFSALLAVTRRSAAGLGPWIALVQLAVAAAVVTGGILVLGGRRRWLLAAAGAELALAGYWWVVLAEAPTTPLGDGMVSVPLVFAVLAAVSAGLTFLPASRDWERTERSRRGSAARATTGQAAVARAGAPGA